MTLAQVFFEINKNLCEAYSGLNPLELLNYPAVDVFDLIKNHIDYANRHPVDNNVNAKVIKKQAGDDWF